MSPPPVKPGGLLLLDKPKGLTSHDLVLMLRRRLPPGTKVGHAGTLDPLASGLLLLLIGSATKSAAWLQKLPKSYSGSIRIGTETDSGDLDGRILRQASAPEGLGETELRAAMAAHHGALEMPPPMYSAVKYKGKPLYSYARKGIEVPLRNRTFHVYAWELTDWRAPELRFLLSCSHGTYARSLAISLGRRLGCGAVLSDLRRDSVGGYVLSQAVSMEEFKALPLEGLLSRVIPAAPPIPA